MFAVAILMVLHGALCSDDGLFKDAHPDSVPNTTVRWDYGFPEKLMQTETPSRRITVRLVSGSNLTSEGRVEVFRNGTWGTICAEYFDYRSARVICRMLGYEIEQPIIYDGAHYGQGTGDVWLDATFCVGNESDIMDCVHYPVTFSTCSHRQDLGIKCQTTTADYARLVSHHNTSTQGRVEVYINGLWGTVCDDDFDVLDARVICRMLGYDIQFPVFHTKSYYGQGDGDIWLDNVRCNGTESDIFQCVHNGLGNHDCNPSKDVGVNCQPTTKDLVKLVSLVDTPGGRVEVFTNGSWSTICQDGFDVEDARVVCRMLGHESDAPVVHSSAYYGSGEGKVWHGQFKCKGNESDIFTCERNGTKKNTCNNNTDVGVNCQSNSSVNWGTVRLVSNRDISEGRIEVFLEGSWGTVCEKDFDVNDARVVCRMLGYEVANPFVHDQAYYGRGTGNIFLSGVKCNGTEANLMQCEHSGLGVHFCRFDHRMDVGVNCKPSSRDYTRLSLGSNITNGRLEVFRNGTWGTVCSDNFDDDDARVACRTIGFETDYPIVRIGDHVLSDVRAPSWLNDIRCNGTESDIADCGYSDGIGRCDKYTDVSVDCRPSALEFVRLVYKDYMSSGRVEILLNGSWRTICADRFSTNEARVICNMLGFKNQHPLVHNGTYYGAGKLLQAQGSFQCNGSEGLLHRCTRNTSSSRNCAANDVGVDCRSYTTTKWGSVRLASSGNAFEGRVEVFLDGYWLSVCQDQFDVQAARVVCRMQGYPDATPLVHTKDFYGRGTSSSWLSLTGCNGTESSLMNCRHNGLAYPCYYGRYVGVNCRPTPRDYLRLIDDKESTRKVAGKNNSRGRVEVSINGSWGSVCDEGFDDKDARVVCRMLGYEMGRPMVLTREFRGGGQIWMSKVTCNGSELNIMACGYAPPTSHTCTHSQDVGVKCQTTSNDFVKLVSRFNKGGRVEVFTDGAWNTLCDDGFDINSARVICRMSGYDNENPVIHVGAYYGKGSVNTTKGKFICNGTETDIFNCEYSSNDSLICEHEKDVGVNCHPDAVESNITVRLVSNRSRSEGRVEVFLEKDWGTVCDNNFDVNDARVVCRMLGYEIERPTVHGASTYGLGTGNIWLDEVACSGTESNILNCEHKGVGVTKCSHYDDVGVNCHPPRMYDVMLTGSVNPWEGRVEVYFGSRWGTVCIYNFDVNDARVICRMLGFNVKKPIAYRNESSPALYIPIWLDNLDCRGTEDNVFDCPRTPHGLIPCNHHDDVSLNCNTDNHPVTIRLSGGSYPWEGRVEMSFGGSWGQVCDVGFDVNDARVICNMIGYNNTTPDVLYGSFYGAGSDPIWIQDMACSGKKQDIKFCSYSFGGKICTRRRVAGVNCQPDTLTLGVRLVNGTHPWVGRLEVFYAGSWGTVCDHDFTAVTAGIVCRMLGYVGRTPLVYHRAYFGSGTQRINWSGVKCNGTELNIFLCHHGGEYTLACGHSDDVGIDCQQAVGEIHAPPEKTEKSASMDNVYIGVGIGIATLIIAAVVVNVYLYIREKQREDRTLILSRDKEKDVVVMSEFENKTYTGDTGL